VEKARQRQIQAESYEEAAQNGFHGSYSHWWLESPHSSTLRKPGTCAFISSLKRVDQPPDDQLIHFLPREWDRDRLGINYRIPLYAHRHVLKDGENWGKQRMTVTVSRASPEATEGMWLRPYFNPEDKSLRYQTKDGSDSPYRQSLTSTNASRTKQSLLRLAVAEGLLERVPARELPSLHFHRTLESGFLVEAAVKRYKRLSGKASCQAVLRLRTGTSFQFVFYPDIGPDCEILPYFPYIADDGTLHLWDVDRVSDIRCRLHNQGTMSDGATREVVRRSAPALFALAQSEGFWKDPSVVPFLYKMKIGQVAEGTREPSEGRRC